MIDFPVVAGGEFMLLSLRLPILRGQTADCSALRGAAIDLERRVKTSVKP
jgi:hypothetical protein